jgi:formate dehydrogenase subunit gamma
MAATTKPPDADAVPPETPILRFDRVERVAHWVNAALFGIVMLTGAVLYIGQLSVLVGNRQLVRFLHVYCGLAIPVAFLAAYARACRRPVGSRCRAVIPLQPGR